MLAINGLRDFRIKDVYLTVTAFVYYQYYTLGERGTDPRLVWFCGSDRNHEAKSLDVMVRSLIGQLIQADDGPVLFPHHDVAIEFDALVSSFVVLLKEQLQKESVLCLIDAMDYHAWKHEDTESFLQQLVALVEQKQPHAFKLLVTYGNLCRSATLSSHATILNVHDG